MEVKILDGKHGNKKGDFIRTLIIYDNAGRIYYQASGSVEEPQGGVNFLWLDEIPTGKVIDSVDVTDLKNPVPIFSESKLSSEEQRIKDLQDTMEASILAQEV